MQIKEQQKLRWEKKRVDNGRRNDAKITVQVSLERKVTVKKRRKIQRKFISLIMWKMFKIKMNVQKNN